MEARTLRTAVSALEVKGQGQMSPKSGFTK